MIKAARYLQDQQLANMAVESAEAMFRYWVEKPLTAGTEDDGLKGFYQWGSRAFMELAEHGGEGTDIFARRTIDMAHWMIDVHQTLRRTKNTAYAYEGIISAWVMAKRLGDDAARDKFARVIDEGLYKLTTWQVGGPVENAYLDKLKAREPMAIGGVLNDPEEPGLRIDVTQHQMHAVILARRYLYPPPPAGTPR